MVVRSIIDSSGRGPISMVQNADQRDFTGNIEGTPLISASSRVYLNVNQDGIDDTHNVENFQAFDFPAVQPKCDWKAHTHHLMTGRNAPQNSVREFLTGLISTQNNTLPQQFTQPQNLATYISPNKALPSVEQTPQGQNSDSHNLINRLAQALAGIAFKQQTQYRQHLSNQQQQTH